jgi:hypothetical protein
MRQHRELRNSKWTSYLLDKEESNINSDWHEETGHPSKEPNIRPCSVKNPVHMFIWSVYDF